MDKKFAKSCNFSMKEECLLISLVKTYRHEIECKKSNTNSNKIKKQAWDKIDRELNTISGETYRTSQTLRNKYENLKKRTKKKVADMKSNIYGTGGGPPEEIKFNGAEKAIEEMMGSQFAGLSSEFDSDFILEPIALEEGPLVGSEAIEDHIALQETFSVSI
ncbi:Myb/SANT-like DNA-binding domain [Popillia japonica]|uniref:Regulatory protein zeste n=1 Tax=Popillia japonica TaxID=7064 RepID=A0AAW1N851_POPJA